MGVNVITSIRPKGFHRNTAGELLLSLELEGVPIESSVRDYMVDPATLKVSAANKSNTENYLPIPWSVQKKQLIVFTPLKPFDELRSFGRQIVGIKLIIGIDGTVERAEMSDSPEGVHRELAAVMSQWRFRPTVLNGKPTRVLTGFEVRPEDLEDPRWSLK